MADPFELPGVDELFSGDIADFTKRRDELAKQLKQGGDKEAAAAVKALRKPTTAVWAVNQVARRHPDTVADLVRAARAVHDAQARAVSGRDDGGLRNATRAWRELVNELAGLVARDAGEQYRDDAAAMFQSASTNDALAEVLQAGRLTSAVSSTGFGLEGMPEPVERAREELLVMPQPEPEPEPAPVDTEALDEARARLEKTTHRLRRAEQRLEVAQQAVEEATKARDDAAAVVRALEG